MKRTILLLTLAALSFGTAQAQVDIKVGPLGLLFNNLNVGVEFGVNENVGIELTSGIDWKSLPLIVDENFSATAYLLGINGRYYFNPTEKRLNGFYAGAYTRYKGGVYKFTDSDTEVTERFTRTRIAGGFLLGGKIVSRNERIIFDLGIGFGRSFVDKFKDPDGTDEADLSDIPFLNWDIPINLKIGFRIGK